MIVSTMPSIIDTGVMDPEEVQSMIEKYKVAYNGEIHERDMKIAHDIHLTTPFKLLYGSGSSKTYDELTSPLSKDDDVPLTREEIFYTIVRELTLRNLFKGMRRDSVMTREKSRRLATVEAVKTTWYYFNNQELFKSQLFNKEEI